MPAPATFARSTVAVAMVTAMTGAGCSASVGRDAADAAPSVEDTGDEGDSAGDEPVPTYAPTFTAVYGEILGPMCAGLYCHGGSEAFLPMGTPDVAYGAMVNVVSHGPNCAQTGLKIVAPGDPDASLLYLKVTAPPCGNRMPAGYEPYLDGRETDQISQWITLGAPDN